VAVKEQQRWQLPVMQFVTLVLMAILLIALGHFAKTMLENHRLSAQKAMLEAQMAREEAEGERLRAQQAYVASDAYQRQLAHEMGLFAPDERPLVLILPPEMEEDVRDFDPIYREGKVLEPPYWQQWWELFFGDGNP
jgi:hypothetical protein